MASRTKVFDGKRYTLDMMGMGRRDATQIARNLRKSGLLARLGSKEGDGAIPVYARKRERKRR